MSFDEINKEILDFLSKWFHKRLIQFIIVVGLFLTFSQNFDYLSGKIALFFPNLKEKKYASHITFSFEDSTLRPISGITINYPKNIKKIDEFTFVLDTNLSMTIQPLEIINSRRKSVEIHELNIVSDSIQQTSIQIK